jgi:hypothetical protein
MSEPHPSGVLGWCRFRSNLSFRADDRLVRSRGFAAQVPTIPVRSPRTESRQACFQLDYDPTENPRYPPRDHRERQRWGIPSRGESNRVKLMLVWRVPRPVVGLVRTRLEVSGRAKILAVNLPPFYRVLPQPLGISWDPSAYFDPITKFLDNKLLSRASLCFLGARSGPFSPILRLLTEGCQPAPGISELSR